MTSNWPTLVNGTKFDASFRLSVNLWPHRSNWLKSCIRPYLYHICSPAKNLCLTSQTSLLMKMSLERTTENVETMAAAAEPEAGILLVAPSINLDGLSEKYLQAKKREGKKP